MNQGTIIWTIWMLTIVWLISGCVLDSEQSTDSYAVTGTFECEGEGKKDCISLSDSGRTCYTEDGKSDLCSNGFWVKIEIVNAIVPSGEINTIRKGDIKMSDAGQLKEYNGERYITFFSDSVAVRRTAFNNAEEEDLLEIYDLRGIAIPLIEIKQSISEEQRNCVEACLL